MAASNCAHRYDGANALLESSHRRSSRRLIDVVLIAACETTARAARYSAVSRPLLNTARSASMLTPNLRSALWQAMCCPILRIHAGVLEYGARHDGP